MFCFKEFECGVHFGGGENAKQEWSFTLYDFDGHGKITKEVCVSWLIKMDAFRIINRYFNFAIKHKLYRQTKFPGTANEHLQLTFSMENSQN